MGCARQTREPRSRRSAGSRGERERERERIARRAKVPSKHGTGMTRNSAEAGSAFQANVMRCEAINAPSTRLDLRLHRHGAYSAASIARLSSRAFKALLPARPIPLRTGRRLFSSLRIISIYSSTPCPPPTEVYRPFLPPSLHHRVLSVLEPDRDWGWIYSPFFATFFRPERAVIYGDASINVATRRFEY